MDEDAQATQLELRVLTGLHQGAALLLIDQEIVLGSALACDVVLLDDGIAPRHLHICMRDTGWTWKPGGENGGVDDSGSGGVFSPDAPPGGAGALLGRGSRLCIANVWLMLAGVADPWPLPAELLAWQRQQHEVLALQAAEAAQAAATPPRRKAPAIVLACLFLGLVSAFLVAFSMLLPHAKEEAAAAADGVQTPGAAGRPLHERAAPPMAAAPVSALPVLAPAQVQSIASALLAEHQLEQAVRVEAEPGRLRLHATLGPRGRANFEHSLLALQRRFGASTRIEATVTSAEATLPFRIRQVLMGGDSRVVLADGRAMYEGDQLGGFRLVSIREGVIVFTGPRKVEVAW